MRPLPALLALSLLLVACGQAPETNPPPAAPMPKAPGGAPSASELSRLQARDPKEVARVVSRFDYLLHYRMMQMTGIESALGGEAQALAALQAVGTAYERKIDALLPQTARLMPAAFTGEGMQSGVVGLGLAGFTGLMTGSVLASSVSSMSDQQLAELVRQGPMKFGDKTGNAELQVGEDGSLDQELAFDVEQSGLSGKVKLKLRVDACPDAQGKVGVSMDVDSSMHVSAKPGTGGSVHTRFKLDRWLDDDARLIDSADGMATEMQMEIGGVDDGSDRRMARTIRMERDGTSSSAMTDWRGFNIFTDTPAVEMANALIEQSHLMLVLIAEMQLRGMGKGPAWESGRCVELKVTSDPARRRGIRPNTAFDLAAMPRAKADGAPTGGNVVATLEGGESLQPASGKVRADAHYQYAGPAKKDEKSTIAFEARSKRGVGRAVLEFDTKQGRSYRITGLGTCNTSHTVCDVDQPFSFPVCGGTMQHTPTSDRGGTHSFEHSGARGSGSYSLDGPEAEMTATYQNTTCAMGRCFKTPNGRAVWTKIDSCE